MDVDTRTPLILGRPFLSTANANIDVGAGEIHLNINDEEEHFTFKPKVEQCSQYEWSIEKILTLCKKVRWPRPNPRSGMKWDPLITVVTVISSCRSSVIEANSLR
jgi:hypothetical protein